MRVLHTADWHLGMDLYKVTLMEDQRWFKQQLKAIIENYMMISCICCVWS